MCLGLVSPLAIDSDHGADQFLPLLFNMLQLANLSLTESSLILVDCAVLGKDLCIRSDIDLIERDKGDPVEFRGP